VEVVVRVRVVRGGAEGEIGNCFASVTHRSGHPKMWQYLRYRMSMLQRYSLDPIVDEVVNVDAIGNLVLENRGTRSAVDTVDSCSKKKGSRVKAKWEDNDRK
jgi:hypothetical protein